MSAILDEFCTVCNYNRKYAIRRLKTPKKQSIRKPGPKPTYDSSKLLTPLKAISSASIDRMLKPIRVMSKRHGMYATKPGTLVKNRIVLKTHNWDEKNLDLWNPIRLR